MRLLVFGSSSFSSQCFNDQVIRAKLFNKKDIFFLSSSKNSNYYFDLENPNNSNFNLFRKPLIIVSFAPIWLLSEFLIKLKVKNLKNNIKLLISTSSTSALTKRYAFNSFDKELSSKLLKSENILTHFCKNNNVNLKIVRTSMIYGRIKEYKDKNIEKLAEIIKKSPIVCLPNNCGLRQPIHIKDVSDLYIKFIKDYFTRKASKESIIIYNIGGDEILSYDQMLIRIKNKYPFKKKENFCLIVKIPSRIFYAVLFPIFIFSPRIYESILRIKADLSGFTKVSKLLKTKAKNFPVNIEKSDSL